MNIIYKLYTSISELLLEKYLVEFYFFTEPSANLSEYNSINKTNYQGDFKCYLPIVFMVRNYDELENLVAITNSQLVELYACKPITTTISEKIGSDKMLETKIISSENKLKSHKLGIIDIMTFTPRPLNNGENANTYSQRSSKKRFSIIKSGPNIIRDNFEYLISYYKVIPEE